MHKDIKIAKKKLNEKFINLIYCQICFNQLFLKLINLYIFQIILF